MKTDPRDSTASSDSTGRGFSGWLRAMPLWKKLLVSAAVLATVVGGVLMLLDSGASHSAGKAGPSGGATAFSGTNLLPGGQEPGAPTPAAGAAEPASRGVFRLGFSFVVGFSLGTFARAMLKVAAIAFGFWLALTFTLAYFGLLHVDWQAIDGLWSHFTGNVEQEWGDFQRFITGSLPAAGLAGLGLFAGLKRK